MKNLFFLILIMMFFCSNNSKACTDFLVKAKDGTVVNGRTMEFPIDLESKIWIVPRGMDNTSVNDKGIKGLSWKAKYAFIGIDGFNLKDTYVEGINEKGLSYGGLMYTGAKYQKAEPGKFVTYADLASWILGNFATVDEVKKELPRIMVADKYIKNVHGSLGIHIAIHDATGKSLVVEFINGEQKIYDNKVGVITNHPDFNWQMTNLSNYINLDHADRTPRTINGYDIEPTGVGSGMLGLPGDWTPPSRFIRTAYAVDAALTPKNSSEAINLAEHLMNIVDIPKGVIKEKVNPVIHIYGYAQWSIIKDLTNKVLYFRTYDNMTLRKIDLKNVDISEGSAKRSLVISKSFPLVIDTTEALK